VVVSRVFREPRLRAVKQKRLKFVPTLRILTRLEQDPELTF
jgi:hypothetical protein